MMNQEVRRIMTIDPPVTNPSQNVSEVAEWMIANGINQVPVVEEGKLAGMLTTHDMWRALRKSPEAESLTVSQVMNTKVIKIAPKDKVGTAAELFMDRRFKTLPVVNLNNELKGVVTSFDVLRHAMREEYKNPILFGDVIEQQEAV